MPKHLTESSTTRRRKLAEFVESFGDNMVKPCSTCKANKRSCKVHIRSGKCSECIRRGQRCDLQVTQSEWERLKKEKSKLRQGIKEAFEAQEQARAAEERARAATERALDEQRTAFAREMRLRQQMDLLDSRAAEAISVEENNIRELEGEVIELSGPSEGLALNLSPHTWSALDDLPESFWELSSNFPGGASPPTGTVS